MSEQAGLLRAICEQPDENAPRLVYADWLEDHGDPALAEYIRREIALADLPEHDPARVRHERALLDHDADVDARSRLPQAPSPGFIAWWPYSRRGFPWMVSTEHLDMLLREAPRLFEIAPIQGLHLDVRRRPDLAPLAAAPWLERMVRLEFVLGYLDATSVRQLLDSPHLSGVTELAFDFGGITGDGLRELLTSPLVGRLRSLSLRRNFQMERGRPLAEALAVAAPMPLLETLDVADNAAEARALAPLAGGGLTPALRDLHAGGNEFGQGRVPAARLGELARLETLRLEHTKPGVPGVTALGALAGLRALHLRGTQLGPVAVRKLAGSPAMSSLRLLDLSDTSVGDGGAAALAASPHASGLLSLSLRNADLTDKGARALLEAPALSGLIYLDIQQNEFSPAVRAQIRERFGQWSASDSR